ncbi:hypothetical protein GCM10027595_09900 [Corynebacterium nasicanis]
MGDRDISRKTRNVTPMIINGSAMSLLPTSLRRLFTVLDSRFFQWLRDCGERNEMRIRCAGRKKEGDTLVRGVALLSSPAGGGARGEATKFAGCPAAHYLEVAPTAHRPVVPIGWKFSTFSG